MLCICPVLDHIGWINDETKKTSKKNQKRNGVEDVPVEKCPRWLPV